MRRELVLFCEPVRDFAWRIFSCESICAHSSDSVLIEWMVIKNSLSVSCLFQSVIRGLFVGFYGVFLWLVMPDENKYLQVLRILGVSIIRLLCSRYLRACTYFANISLFFYLACLHWLPANVHISQLRVNYVNSRTRVTVFNLQKRELCKEAWLSIKFGLPNWRIICQKNFVRWPR